MNEFLRPRVVIALLFAAALVAGLFLGIIPVEDFLAAMGGLVSSQ